MAADEDLLNFLQLHPELYSISQSNVYMAVLSACSSQAKSIESLREVFPLLDPSDLEAIVLSLNNLNALTLVFAGGKKYYYLSNLGKLFLEKYTKAKSAIGE